MYQKMSSLAKVMIGTSMLGIYGILFPNQASAVNCWEIHDLSECAKHPECMEHQEANGFCQGKSNTIVGRTKLKRLVLHLIATGSNRVVIV
jgi:hypothetical protein